MNGSTPSISEFDPGKIAWQYGLACDVRKNFDYKLLGEGTVHEWLASGSVGSAKSILGAHLGVTHCLMYPRSRLCLGRRAMPDLKDTILAKVLDHMDGDLVEGVHFEHNETKGKVEFFNGSEIVSRSWGDGNFKKVRSLELSAALIEEASENDDGDKEAITELRMRVGRLPHVPESWIGYMTNPDSPDHWLHKYFMESQVTTRHVYYSVTTDNPFLPRAYVEQLKSDLDPLMAQRMIYGKWVRINEEVVYHAYSGLNFKNYKYDINPVLPIHINFDFNIGSGKPMSACLHQIVQDAGVPKFHFFQEHVVEGARTENILDEISGSGVLDIQTTFHVHMDATGKHRDTRSIKSDYDLISHFLANYKTKSDQPIRFFMEVPSKNPPIRTRHNLVNGSMKNSNSIISLFVYATAKKLHEGFLKTKLLKGANYTEDDSKDYQHVTTAAGYGICWEKLFKRSGQTTIQL